MKCKVWLKIVTTLGWHLSQNLLWTKVAVQTCLKTWSENMQQIYRRTPMSKCDFNKVASNFIKIALWHGCSPINLLHTLRPPFPKNTSGRLLLCGVPSVVTDHLWRSYPANEPLFSNSNTSKRCEIYVQS